LFWNADERRLRAGWRIALQLMIAALLAFLPILLIAEPLTALHRSGLFLARLGHDDYDRVINMIVGPLFACGIIAGIVIAARWLDRRPLAHYGDVFDAAWWKALILGFAVSGSVMLALFGVESLRGDLAITGFFAMNRWLWFSVVKVLCVGAYEEFLSRGYILRNLADGMNLPIAVAISSFVFAALHLGNENASALSTIGLFVNALFFASAALLTRRLSAAIGAHIGWNLFEGAILGFPVSGDKERASLIGIRQLGNAVFTGGDFGPEAGLIGIAASLCGIGAFWLITKPARENRLSRPAA